jgi:hypothetical protein
MNEEIVFGMGMDTSGFATGMRDVKRIAADGAAKVKSTFAEMGTSILGAFGGLAILDKVRKALDFGESITHGAEAAGVSTDMFQNLGLAIREAGGNADEAEGALTKLNIKIGEARDGNDEAISTFENLGIALTDGAGRARTTEDIFRDVADKIQNTADGGDKARIAFEIFGRAGADLIPVLNGGAAAIDKFNDSMQKLNKADLSNLHEAKRNLDDFGNTLTIIAGKTVGYIAYAGSFYGALTTEGMKGVRAIDSVNTRLDAKRLADAAAAGQSMTLSNAQKILKAARDASELADIPKEQQILLLNQRQAAAMEASNAAKAGSLDKTKKETELLKITDELHRAELDNAKEIAAAAAAKAEWMQHQADLQRELNDAKEQESDLEQSLADKKEKRTRLSLEELETSKVRFTGTLGEDQKIAHQIQRLQKQEEWNRLNGWFVAADAQDTQIASLRKQFSSNVPLADRDPDRKTDEHIARMSKHIDDLAALIHGGKGVPVDVTLAP